MGSVWRRLGAEVTVVEFLDRITPGMDTEIASNLQKIFKKQGIKFKLATKVMGAEAKADGSGATLSVEPVAGGAAETLEADVVLAFPPEPEHPHAPFTTAPSPPTLGVPSHAE